ncbi:MAG: hypothetical protein V1813_03735 [Candidatus Aenigmatarchaeota archaeon]
MRKLVLPLALVFILLSSGCVSLDPTSLVKATPAVSKFLEQYPNAEVKAVHYTIEESASIIDDIMADCEKEAVTPKEYYKVTITDAESDLDVVAWVDVKAQLVECVVKRGSTGGSGDVEVKPAYHECTAEEKAAEACTMEYHAVCAQVDTGIRCITTPCPSTEWKTFGNSCSACATENVLGWKEGACGVVCQSKYKVKCDAGHVYWFDSCGNNEGKKEYCPLGCSDGACIKDEKTCEVEKNYLEKPSCNCPDGYEMIVIYPKCEITTTSGGGYAPTTGAITGMPIAEAVQTHENYVKISEAYTTVAGEKCEGGQPFYRCVKKSECQPYAKAVCDGGHVYWVDSCGNVQEKKEYCENGCENGACRTTGCTDSDGGFDVWERGYVSGVVPDICAYITESSTVQGTDSCEGKYPDCFLIEDSCDKPSKEVVVSAPIWDNTSYISYVNCPYGCENGACVPATVCPQLSTPAPGWCEGGIPVSSGSDENGCQLPPRCLKNETVCCESYGYGAQMTKCCETYAWTTAAECTVPEGFVGGGKNYLPDSYCSASCSSDEDCGETVCTTGGLSVHDTCENDVCVKAACPNTCADSDGGKNFYVYGTIAGPDEDGEGNQAADYCWPDGKGIMEGYCTDAGYVNFYSMSCSNGCENGVCLQDTCTNSTLTLGESKTIRIPSSTTEYTVTLVGPGTIEVNGASYSIGPSTVGHDVRYPPYQDTNNSITIVHITSFENGRVSFQYECP